VLSNSAAATMIPARSLDSSRRFYEDVLGFSPVREDPGSIRYRTADGQFNLYQTEFAGTAQHTLIGRAVSDIDAAVRELAAKGVRFERYDMPDLTTDDAGIADMGTERGAWFKDPEGNLLSVWQLSD
jgi:catechol 2,3-dioxygenase-like lactoylglutathione lyase family enzyme